MVRILPLSPEAFEEPEKAKRQNQDFPSFALKTISEMAAPAGIEPAAHGLGNHRSIP
jgi:hypothetical protein